ncbi:uncharacterized protein FFB14_08650 [Fusarium fujikuroi]|nr:uncharacterized protein FFB14_08650 [Fusarium fujikuroi]
MDIVESSSCTDAPGQAGSSLPTGVNYKFLTSDSIN